MRTSLILCLLCFSSCIFHDLDLNSGIARYDTQGERNYSNGGSSSNKHFPVLYNPQYDTAIYVCAVAFSDSYDWQNDPSYGSEPYELILYKDFEEILRISSSTSTCTSPDHDTHHIIDGQLYTEYSGTSYTAIGLNGVEIIRFSTREFLKGLLPLEGDVYTLSQRRDGTGFTFRKNGEVMLTKTGYTIFGSMNDPSYGATGALYLDEEEPTFCYWGGSGSSARYYRVKNGVEEELEAFNGESYDDLKSIGGNIYTSVIDNSNYSTLNCRVWYLNYEYEQGHTLKPLSTLDGTTATAGHIRYASDFAKRDFMGVYYHSTKQISDLLGTISEGTIYCTPDANALVYESSENVIEFILPDSSTKSESNCYFLSANCATLVGNKFVYALSSKISNTSPKVWTGTNYREVPIHGYVSRVSTLITPIETDE